MGSTTISTKLLISSLTPVLFLEWAAASFGHQIQLPRLWLIGIVRIAQAVAILGVIALQTGELTAIGIDKKSFLPGVKKGLLWSAGFAVAAGLMFLICFAIGQNPLAMIRSPLPQSTGQRILFFIIGGFIAPVAEEILFRGLLFGYLRRWGLPSAIVLTTVLFAALHMGQVIPYTQIVGGLVFAIAYHMGKSLCVPILIHSLGNLAIFSLSLL
jgi:membrane protease YdiL (CAAX protease family)